MTSVILYMENYIGNLSRYLLLLENGRKLVNSISKQECVLMTLEIFQQLRHFLLSQDNTDSISYRIRCLNLGRLQNILCFNFYGKHQKGQHPRDFAEALLVLKFSIADHLIITSLALNV